MKPVKKIKPGKEYRVREDLEVGEFYGRCAFNNSMKQYKGKNIVFDNVDKEGDSSYDGYWYCPEMLEKVKKDKWKPIKEWILIFDIEEKTSENYFFDNAKSKEFFIHVNKIYTHWRPMPKGPKT